jgi:hypothetical protein
MDPDLTDSHSDLVTAGPQSLWLARIVLRQDDPFIRLRRLVPHQVSVFLGYGHLRRH